MKASVMTYGARNGKMTTLKRRLTGMAMQPLKVFVVPGEDVLRAMGLDLSAAGLEPAARPGEADMLLAAGRITDMLAEKAAVIFLQMPRPRLLAFAGTEEARPLPPPDMKIALSQEGLVSLSREARILLRANAWSTEAKPFTPSFIKEESEKKEGSGHEHHGHQMRSHEGPERPSADHEHSGMHHPHGFEGSHPHEMHEHHEHHPMNMEGMDLKEGDRKGMDMDMGTGMEGMDMKGMDMGGMGFMSMVSMTKDLPESADGLRMERTEAAFGPFFPGLPGGLNLNLELDGDTVTGAVIEKGACGNIHERLPMAAEKFPALLAGLHPLAPVSYCLLARRALQKGLNKEITAQEQMSNLLLLEQERIYSHLNWLIGFSVIIGNSWMKDTSREIYWRLKEGRAKEEELTRFIQRIQKVPFLKITLSRTGAIPNTLVHHATGPVAKAAGVATDLRSNDPVYSRFSFRPVVLKENNVYGRLMVRLSEIAQSCELLQKAKKERAALSSKAPDFPGQGNGRAEIETPRGKAALAIEVRDGQVVSATLHTPSMLHTALTNAMIKEMELGDALKTIASLDISPWETSQQHRHDE